MSQYPAFKVSQNEMDDSEFMKCYLKCGTPQEGGAPKNDDMYECWTKCRTEFGDRLLTGDTPPLTEEDLNQLEEQLAGLTGGRRKKTRRRKRKRRKNASKEKERWRFITNTNTKFKKTC